MHIRQCFHVCVCLHVYVEYVHVFERELVCEYVCVLYGRVCMCACMRVYVCMCVCMCVYVCMSGSEYMCGCVSEGSELSSARPFATKIERRLHADCIIAKKKRDDSPCTRYQLIWRGYSLVMSAGHTGLDRILPPSPSR